MDSVDLASHGRQPEGLRSHLEQCRRLIESQPGADAFRSRAEARNLAIGAERTDAFSGPAIAVAGPQPIAIEQARERIISGKQDELADGFHRLEWRAVALSAPPSR